MRRFPSEIKSGRVKIGSNIVLQQEHPDFRRQPSREGIPRVTVNEGELRRLIVDVEASDRARQPRAEGDNYY